MTIVKNILPSNPNESNGSRIEISARSKSQSRVVASLKHIANCPSNVRWRCSLGVFQVFVVVVPSMIPLGQSPTLIRRHQLFKGPFGGFPEMSADPVAECFKTGRSSSPSVNERECERPFWKWSLVETPLLEWSLRSQGVCRQLPDTRSMMSVFLLFSKVRRSGQAVYNSSIIPHGGVHAGKNQAKPDCQK